MADKRRLQGDIERNIKRVQEGRVAFQDILDKFDSATNQTHKEKFEADLKKEIKKLQRLRDQIKTWLTSNEVKDKRALLEARKEIEQDMERFKVIEKETKTKAYSKEGLVTETKKDPLQKEKEEMVEWLKQCISTLNEQVEKYEFDIDSLLNSNKKKRVDRQKQEVIEEKRSRHSLHRWHIDKLETIMRLLDNEKLECDDVKGVKESVEYYIDSQDSAEFSDLDDRGVYDDLDLDELIDLNSTVVSMSDVDISNVGDVDSLTQNSSPLAVRAVDFPSQYEVNTSVTPEPVKVEAEKYHPEDKGHPPQQPIKQRKGSTSTGSSSTPIKSTTVTSQPIPGSHVVSSVASGDTLQATSGSSIQVPSSNTRVTSPAPLPTVTSSTPSSKPISYTTTLASSVVSQHQPFASPSPHMPSGIISIPSSFPKPAISVSTQPQLQSTSAISVASHVALTAPSPALPASVPLQTSVSNSQMNPPLPQQIMAPPMEPPTSLGFTNHLAVERPADNNLGMAAQQAFRQPVPPGYMTSQRMPINMPLAPPGLGQFSAPPQKEMPSVITLDSRDAIAPFRNPNMHPEVIKQMLTMENALKKMPYPGDTDRARLILYKVLTNTPPYYPSEPVRACDTEEYYSKLDAKTLFFIFYYFEGTKAQYLAAKALKKQSWRFHTKLLTWFQRHEEPSKITDEFEAGTYKFYEVHTMTQQTKEDFVFHYRFLEDKDF